MRNTAHRDLVERAMALMVGGAVLVGSAGLVGGAGLLSGAVLSGCSILAPSDEELGGARCPEGYADGDLNPTNGCVPVPSEGLKFWLAADDLPPSADGVRVWEDRSLASRDAIQQDPISQPIAIANGIGTRTALRFDGEQHMVVAGSFSDLQDGLTFAVVTQRDAGVGPGYASATLLDIKGGTSVPKGVFFVRRYESDDFHYGIDDKNDRTPGMFYAPDAFPADQPLMFVVLQDADQVRIRSCGEEVQHAAILAPSTVHDGGSIGKNRATNEPATYTGVIGEMLFYRRPLSDTELALLESYLRDKWDVCP